ncbi:MAG TPA: DUF1232 domain-containing protein [Ignavibacteria bacterium]|nr:DUF1232 domain-containing protein [Ignavibacteria bacterium]
MDDAILNMSEAERKQAYNKALRKEKTILDKAKTLDISKFRKLLNQVMLLMELIKDYKSKAYIQIPWTTVTVAAFGLIYFLNPFDLIPDYIPGIGYVDDAIVLAAILKSAQSDLKKYCTFKGYDIEKYF